MKKHRIVYDYSEKEEGETKKLKKIFRARTNKGLVNTAFNYLRAFVQYEEQGYEVEFIAKKGEEEKRFIFLTPIG